MEGQLAPPADHSSGAQCSQVTTQCTAASKTVRAAGWRQKQGRNVSTAGFRAA